ncbi:MAG: hypothetical protein ACK4FL_02515 [Microgenomates group bacterium]
MKKIAEKLDKKGEILFYCSCGCKSQLLLVDFEEGRVEFNTRLEGRRRWTGAVLDAKGVKKLKKFLEERNKA